MFVAAIDQTLLATATPAIAKEFGELRDTTWIALGYLIAGTITIPLYGRLGDRIGRKRVLLAAISLFAMGSVACGLADSMLLLSVSRVLQGLGGGGLMVTSQALIGELVPPRERPRFQGYFAANFTLASLAGPIVGGYVVAHASWRWLFLVNIPLMALALWRVGRLPSHRARCGSGAADGRPRRPDLCGGGGHHAGLGHLRRTPVPVVLYAKWPAHHWCRLAMGAARAHGAACCITVSAD